MEFDKEAPGGGLEITTTIQSGKAYLEYKVYVKKEEQKPLLEAAEESLDIQIWDKEGQLVFWGCYPMWQEEPAKGVILHPRLWQGTEDPYLYSVRAVLVKGKECVTDVLEKSLALRTFCEIPMKGWFLNDRPLEIRAVAYEIPEGVESTFGTKSEWREKQIRKDLELIKKMGANGICPLGEGWEAPFYRICDEMGLLLWHQFDEKMPRFWGMAEGLVSLEHHIPTDRYYFYKACWSKEPFVYISRESIVFAPNGNIRVTVYSNQPKVALYIDSVLFEFRTEGPDFVFEEIPVKTLPLMITAETRECSMSVTTYPRQKTFT